MLLAVLEVVARRALAVTVVVAPPAQLVAPGSRAPNLTRPAMYPHSLCFIMRLILASADNCHPPNGNRLKIQRQGDFLSAVYLLFICYIETRGCFFSCICSAYLLQ